jgi:CMP-N,N'-diacetyllegionaminic acid synthase
MKIAFIPARSGSKGVPDKNIYPIWGKPLIWWAAQCALKSGIFDRIVLSTDSEKYAEIAIDAGCEIPGLRKRELSSDTSKIADTLLEFIQTENLNNASDSLCILEPTCPLRNPDMLRKGYAYFEKKTNLHSLVSVTAVPVKYHPLKQLYIQDDNMVRFADERSIHVANRQELDPSYIRNGAFYFIRCASFMQTPKIVTQASSIFVLEEPLINIDAFEDIEQLEMRYGNSQPDWIVNH